MSSILRKLLCNLLRLANKGSVSFLNEIHNENESASDTSKYWSKLYVSEANVSEAIPTAHSSILALNEDTSPAFLAFVRSTMEHEHHFFSHQTLRTL